MGKYLVEAFLVLFLISFPSFLHNGTAFFLVGFFFFFCLYYQRAFYYMLSYSLQDRSQLSSWVQTLSLDFLTSQMFLACGLYFCHSVWTQLISSTLFYKVLLGCWLQLRKSYLFSLQSFSVLQNRHNSKEFKCHFYCHFTMLYYVSAILKFPCLPFFSLIWIILLMSESKLWRLFVREKGCRLGSTFLEVLSPGVAFFHSGGFFSCAVKAV